MHALVLRLRPAAPPRCRVRVGRGALALLARDLGAARPAHVAVVSDSNVAPLYGPPLVRALRRAGLRTDLIVFPAGERHKNRGTKATLEDRLAAIGAERGTTIVALGGGVTCDLAGFVAATWQRGVPLVEAPTTLLAMVDAAIGGKTGVNLPAGKNLVGSFHQPRGIYVDPDALRTLARGRYAEGLAEVVKTALVADARFFTWLERNAAALVARKPAALEHAIVAAVRGKLRVVSADERDLGLRNSLNFGHTVGHAIETASDYRISHGRAVAIGLSAEAWIAVRRTGFPRAAAERLERLLAALGLPRRLPSRLPLEAVLGAMRHDKKTRRGRLRCALPCAIGRMGAGPAVTVEVTRAELRAALARRGAD